MVFDGEVAVHDGTLRAETDVGSYILQVRLGVVAIDSHRARRLGQKTYTSSVVGLIINDFTTYNIGKSN